MRPLKLYNILQRESLAQITYLMKPFNKHELNVTMNNVKLTQFFTQICYTFLLFTSK